ncbi:MAG: VWA domain-containing protein [Anaerolinea sp.]|nr:VWA domain-containing protein [Anaerolinea sp.]
MHRISNKWTLAALALIVLAIGLWAQQPAAPPAAPPSEGELTFSTGTRLVVLYCGVFDRRGRMVTDVDRSAFKVYENNVEQSVRIFRQEDVPLSLGIVIDNSGSMRGSRAGVESASVRLVKSSRRADEVFVVNFNDEAYLDVPFTSDISKLEEGVARIDSRGGTALHDALSMSLDHITAEGKRDKKVILLISDGNDTASVSVTAERLAEKVQKSGVMVYSIGLLAGEDRREARRAKRFLDMITKASGGAAYYPDSVSEVESIADQVAHDIRNQYVIAYSPANQALDGTYRQIKVTAGSRFTVRTRTGYYATPNEAPRRRAGGD